MPTSPVQPTLGALFSVFLKIGLQSFGGGVSGWMQREIVRQRGWMRDRPFVAGVALAQVVPGASAVNLAVFIGGSLRGAVGALVALVAVLLPPFVLIVGLGGLYFSGWTLPGMDSALAGLGEAALGLTFATGWRMARHARGWSSWVIVAGITVAIGVLRVPLPVILLVVLPVALWRARQEDEQKR